MKALLTLQWAVLWLCIGYGCGGSLTPAEQAKLTDCGAQMDEINAGCAARKMVCKEPGCEDVIEAECDTQLKAVCHE